MDWRDGCPDFEEVDAGTAVEVLLQFMVCERNILLLKELGVRGPDLPEVGAAAVRRMAGEVISLMDENDMPRQLTT